MARQAKRALIGPGGVFCEETPADKMFPSVTRGALIDIDDEACMVTVTFDPASFPDRKATPYNKFIHFCHELAGNEGCGIRFVERAA